MRSPTSAELPSGIGTRPHGAFRQVAITASSVGAQGSAGAAEPLGTGDAGVPEGLLGADDESRGDVGSGSAARAVRDG